MSVKFFLVLYNNHVRLHYSSLEEVLKHSERKIREVGIGIEVREE